MEYPLVKFEAWHMEALAHTDAVDGVFSVVLGPEMAQQLEQSDSWTMFSEEGDIVGCGGFLPQWAGRTLGWMYITERCAEVMLRVTRATKKAMDKYDGRLEITVKKDFESGHRWAKILGFHVENPPGILKGFGPGGEDHVSYVRFK